MDHRPVTLADLLRSLFVIECVLLCPIADRASQGSFNVGVQTVDAIEHLAETAWKTPSNYGGFDPIGDYVILTRNRDSELIDESNWECACKSLGAEDHDSGEFESRPPVYTFRASHWAVGWIEYLLVRPDAPEATLKEAGEIVCSLADYPVLNEDHWTQLESEVANETWKNFSVRDRAELLKRVGSKSISIFAARRDYIPSDDNGAIQDALLGH